MEDGELLKEIRELRERLRSLELSEAKRSSGRERPLTPGTGKSSAAVEGVDAAPDLPLELLLGSSAKMKEIIDQVRLIAKTDFTILIQGETGVGKSYLSDIIHKLSPRAANPYIKIDMGTIPESLLESELFGYEKGAFTGAERRRKGMIELAADSGTVFIDELENMTPYAQSRLLTVIEEKRFHPLGSAGTRDVDIRIISATNREIKEALAGRSLRKDLFYRLSEFIITIPPLRERVEDIPFLARKFLLEAEAKLNAPVKKFSDESFEVLKRYPWPGNVRELRNIVMRRAVLMSQSSSLRPAEMEQLLSDGSAGTDASAVLPLKEVAALAVREVEKKAIARALELTGGNKSRAATLLQVNYKTLLIKIREYGLS